MGLYKRGQVWWMSFVYMGIRYRRSTETSKRKIAQEIYDNTISDIIRGENPGVLLSKVKFNELAEDFLREYRIMARRSLDKAERNVRYLKVAFGGMQARQITTSMVSEYIDSKLDRGLSPATINRQLAALKHMFHLAARCTPPKVNRIPYIPMLKENNIRRGFFEHNEFLAVRDASPDYLKPIVTFAYYTGWRKGEILNLTRNKVDLRQGTVSLDPGDTKNEEGRSVYLNDELMEQMLTLSKTWGSCPYVFQHSGQRILKFEKAWNAACRRAGLEGKLFHDFRRTAVRNMVRSGIPERVAMKISGHKTRSVFDRYNIVSDQDLKEAARKQFSFINSQNKETKEVQNDSVTILSQSPFEPFATA